MNVKVFVDTNILLYAHDTGAGEKHRIASDLIADLWDSGSGVLSTQVLQELGVNLRRKIQPPLQSKEVIQLVEDYLSWEVVVNTGFSMVEALGIEARYGVSFWDALILQSVRQSGAEIFYSEDFSSGQKYGSAQVVNPFKRQPA
jgi:predicted nucleic acid-binding protein